MKWLLLPFMTILVIPIASAYGADEITMTSTRILPNDSTDITLDLTSLPIDSAGVKWRVIEPDGDICMPDADGSFDGIAHDPDGIFGFGGGSTGIDITFPYPLGFVLSVDDIGAGNGVCETNDIGNYDMTIVVTQVHYIDDPFDQLTDFNQSYTASFVVDIFVIPESPIGAIALMGSSLAALGAFVYFRQCRNKLAT